MPKSYTTQRNTYKLLENLTYKEFESELALLKSLVNDIVDHSEFEIIGGRIWELDTANNSYLLKYQYGNVNKIPDGYSIQLTDQPLFSKIIQQRTFLNYETDSVLLEKGIKLYSVAGVGDIIRLSSGKFYKYILGFNAPEILQSFAQTLSIISSVATVALRNLTTKVEHQKIQRDIIKASEIQRNLLPDHHLKFHDYDIYGLCIPDSGVGGDYFDYLKNSDSEEERLGILVSDAASKGLPAAVQALFVSGAFRMGMSFATKISHLFSRLNTLIFDTFLYERFVTLFYCELTMSSNRLVLYANAGHCAPIHYRPDTDQSNYLSTTGGLLGLMQHQKYNVENFTMRPGDIIVLFTDGISEARNKEGVMYGEESIINMLRKYHKLTPKEITYYIIEDIQKFSAESVYNDDKTLVIVKREEEKNK